MWSNVEESGRHLLRRLERQARLAGAARSHQGQQPQSGSHSNAVISANSSSRPTNGVGGTGRLWGRGAVSSSSN